MYCQALRVRVPVTSSYFTRYLTWCSLRTYATTSNSWTFDTIFSWWHCIWVKNYETFDGLIRCDVVNCNVLLYVKRTALIPLSCCDSCITTPMSKGARSVGEQSNSRMEMDASACWARSSARISSISSSTWVQFTDWRLSVSAELSSVSICYRHLTWLRAMFETNRSRVSC